MRNRYKNLLQSDKALIEAVSRTSSGSVFEQDVNSVISPALVMYTNWILHEAQKIGIRHLYFLARDGYLIYHIAERLCERNRIDIKCSYFYCSRYALRMAAYRFFDDCAYEKLFINSYKLTAKNMLERAGFNKQERKLVYSDMNFIMSEERVMGRAEFSTFCENVRNSIQFNDILKAKSDAAYSYTIAYIKQEGMHTYNKVGIVDLGWTGSLQYTLKRLLESADIKSKLYGFYMGMLDKPPVTENSTYLTWLFDSTDLLRKSWFSHNLMECICSAPHGMTIGYEVLQDKLIPKLTKPENPPQLVEYIREQAEKLSREYVKVNKMLALRLLRKLMLSPTEEEAEALGVYNFCDDVGEQYHRSVVLRENASLFWREILPFKLFHRDSTDGFYWYYGSVQASNLIIKTFYRYMYLFTRYIIMKIKGG
jgi:hypothetical protein